MRPPTIPNTFHRLLSRHVNGIKWIQSVFSLAHRVFSVSLQNCDRRTDKQLTSNFIHPVEYFLPLWATSVSLSQSVFVLPILTATAPPVQELHGDKHSHNDWRKQTVRPSVRPALGQPLQARVL